MTNVINRHVNGKLPTLVLQLRSSPASVNDQPQSHISVFEMKLNEFRQQLFANIDYFQQIVFNARPKQLSDMNPAEYRRRMEVYQDLLVMSTAIVDRIKNSFLDIMQDYRIYLDNVWSAIENGQNVDKLQRKFERHIQRKISRTWNPVFKEVDRLIREFELSENSMIAYAPSNQFDYPRDYY